MEYGFTTTREGSFEEVLALTKESLSAHGFGVLTEIDVKATMKKKLDVEFDKYIILGACNPPFAYKALQAEKQIGLLLPCNVILYEQDGLVTVSAINPGVAMNMVENDALASIATEVGEKLHAVIDSLSVS
ncbi:MAG: hypothetical protein COU32_02310 [Candidatus Magasanikbacteria bacterium CG10_big_fil_rev_8_21_14_0_10_42_10]|uniref:DUF302 domain-containing protein n=2 Tax=Candidatus Magasanikiibacteriota TaxID=1752731 RepID=A0A2H0TW60_9BACT|nr:MAG: hypothetical protein COU32_02310 [Candidatus Magasanikbacteria bacterium CG10_big_fil_rev_8_21_14_0_10_42_10]PIZ93634.1 MAG: hypothetical protein COX82_02300 [Candidatus Magasanikbacteria bacterium CG_4_10_14_0_2_um_filter_41_10]